LITLRLPNVGVGDTGICGIRNVLVPFASSTNANRRSQVRSKEGAPCRGRTTHENSGKTNASQENSAKDIAFPPDLQRVIDAWPRLPQLVRQEMLAILNAAAKGMIGANAKV
jgi:hypothetical protein